MLNIIKFKKQIIITVAGIIVLAGSLVGYHFYNVSEVNKNAQSTIDKYHDSITRAASKSNSKDALKTSVMKLADLEKSAKKEKGSMLFYDGNESGFIGVLSGISKEEAAENGKIKSIEDAEKAEAAKVAAKKKKEEEEKQAEEKEQADKAAAAAASQAASDSKSKSNSTQAKSTAGKSTTGTHSGSTGGSGSTTHSKTTNNGATGAKSKTVDPSTDAQPVKQSHTYGEYTFSRPSDCGDWEGLSSSYKYNSSTDKWVILCSHVPSGGMTDALYYKYVPIFDAHYSAPTGAGTDNEIVRQFMWIWLG